MYLWVNIPDLLVLGAIEPIGSPLRLMIQESLGDELLPGTFYSSHRIDDNFVVVSSSPERCQAIKDAIELLGEKKIGRKVRTRLTVGPPRENWRHVNEPNS